MLPSAVSHIVIFASYLISAIEGGEVNAEAIERILSSVGVEADKKQLEIVVKQLAGKSVDELMAAGAGKLASMGGGGGGGAAAAGAPAGEAAAAAPAAEEKKKEESEEEEDDDMGFGLFN